VAILMRLLMSLDEGGRSDVAGGVEAVVQEAVEVFASTATLQPYNPTLAWARLVVLV